jgi:hypothetical protein
MTVKLFPVKTAALIAVLAGSTILSATAQTTVVVHPHENRVVVVTFDNNSAEAGTLHRIYHLLATGDHDYKGHRAKAMHAVEAAAKLLKLDLSADLKDKTPQVLSDDKLREAKGQLHNVVGAAAVKDQKRVVKHLNEAIEQLNTALAIR